MAKPRKSLQVHTLSSFPKVLCKPLFNILLGAFLDLNLVPEMFVGHCPMPPPRKNTPMFLNIGPSVYPSCYFLTTIDVMH